jgi:hypothetical protein
MNITTIIPIHEYNEVIETYLHKAIESVITQTDEYKTDIIIVSPIDIKLLVEPKLNYLNNVSYVINEGNTDYQTQINLAVESVTTDYFMVLELDDEINNTYFKNGEAYIKYMPDVDVFLTMMVEVNEQNQGIKLTNEVIWSQQFVGENGEAGFLNINSLKQYSDFKLSGAIFKKSDFINNGKYKTKIKLTFMYEYLLRLLNNGGKVYCIPKIGYKHLSTRENSMFDVYSKTMPMEERKFWFDIAVSESNFNNDRDVDISKLNMI